MDFFESELRKIIGQDSANAVFVGLACYVRLSDTNRAKIQFTTCGTADHYEALQLTILNRNDGQVDTLRLRFRDVLGKKQVSNPNFRDGVYPYAWTYMGKTEWYAYHPTQADYRKLREGVTNYLNVFRPVEEKQAGLETTSVLAETKENDTAVTLIKAMIQYGMDGCWTDSDIIDALVDAGIKKDDFKRAGFENFVKHYFAEPEPPSFESKIQNASSRAAKSSSIISANTKDGKDL